MKISQSYRSFLALIYISAYHWIYVNYLNPVFEYAHYNYYPRALVWHVVSYFLTIAPVFFSSEKSTPANYGAAMLYVFCYAPGQLTISFLWSQSEISLFILQVALAVSMTALFISAKYKIIFFKNYQRHRVVTLSERTEFLIFVLTIISTATMISGDWSHMRLVGFDEVYDLRFQSRDAQVGGVSGYLILWITTCFIPFYAASGFLKKNPLRLSLAVILGLLTYMSNGAKVALLLPYVIVLICFIYSEKEAFLPKLLFFATLSLSALIVIDGPISNLVKSLVVMRTLSTGGWTILTYYDYFVTNGITYYSHINFIENIFKIYPYGDLSLGQVIGQEYSGSTDANFNANFWASDGIAALGTIGIIPATIALSIVMMIINCASDFCEKKLLTIWLTGFWVALLNSPLTTSVVSGGCLLILLLIWHSSQFKPHNSKLLLV